MIVCSFFTPAYAEMAVRLRRSLDKLDIPHDIEPVQGTGKWETNCALKPDFIRHKLRVHGNVAWVDADAEVRRPLELDPYVFAVHRRPELESRRHFASGVVAMQSGALDLADLWVEEQNQNPTMWDQEALYRAWLRWDDRVEATHWLSKSYLTKFDETHLLPTARVVHYQASRVHGHA